MSASVVRFPSNAVWVAPRTVHSGWEPLGGGGVRVADRALRAALLALRLLPLLLLPPSLTAQTEVVTLPVFFPACTAHSATHRQTLAVARADFAPRLAAAGLQVALTERDSCDEAATLVDLVRILRNRSGGTVIGPGLPILCDVTAAMATTYEAPLVTWLCSEETPAIRARGAPVVRTAPSDSHVIAALDMFLTYFRWKHITIVTTSGAHHLAIATDVYLGLMSRGYAVSGLLELPREGAPDPDWTSAQLAALPADTRALLLCVSDVDLVRTLQAVAPSGLSLNQVALIRLDPTSTRNHSETGTMAVTDSPVVLPADVLHNLLVLRATPSCRLHSNGSDTNISTNHQLTDPLYDAVALVMEQLLVAKQLNIPRQGALFGELLFNTTFLGLDGTPHYVINGDLQHCFSLWDYRQQLGGFVVALEVAPSGGVVSGGAILWPTGGAPPPQTCLFINCQGLETVYVLVICLAVAAVIAAAAGSLAFLLRRRHLVKEMERGPNKIFFTSDDLVFSISNGHNKSSKSFKSNSIHLFEKPDLLKSSEHSLSNGSGFDNHTSNFSTRARYNDYLKELEFTSENPLTPNFLLQGDQVFLKELHINNFIMRRKTRSFLKELRDLRHENLNSFVGCYSDPERASFVFEYCNRRSLEDVVHNTDIKLDWDFRMSLLTDLVRGMRYMHGTVLRVHGALKSGNCVVDSRWVLKVTDYGVLSMRGRHQTRIPHKAKDMLWSAPECLRSEDLMYSGTQKSDVYSFAIITQEVVVRGHPFCMIDLEAEDIIKKVRKPPPLCRPSVSQGAAPPQYIQIMKQAWAENPDVRPSFDEIHQQFKDINRGKKLNIVDTMFKMLEKYSNDLEEIVRDRTLQLEEEKKKTEHLLSQMLPKSVAESLLLGKPVEAETYEEVTIYFSDIVGFTTISAMSTPMQVVDLLNDLYTMFDTAIDLYDVYKVETIGDAYMVVSGLPEKNGDRHAGEISSMALHILSGCGQFKIRHMPDIPLRLRIGLHTGPCVTGVVGLRMPRYCLFGDTVNTASRMESTGTAFRIHVSEMTKSKLDVIGGYFLEFRGDTELKGKGIHRTYWLIGKEGFSRPLPQPPPLTGEDNHGLGAYLTPQLPNQPDPPEAGESPPPPPTCPSPAPSETNSISSRNAGNVSPSPIMVEEKTE